MPLKDRAARLAFDRARYRERKSKFPDKVRAEVRERMRRHRARIDKETMRDKWRNEYYKRDKVRINSTRRNYYKKNRRLIISRVDRRIQNAGPFDVEKWMMRLRLYGLMCAYCGMKLTDKTATVDHVIPIIDGGTNTPANLVPACRHCNSSKHRKHIVPRNFSLRVLA